MKIKYSNIIIIFLLISFSVGCKKNFVISQKQEALFQFEYIKNTWDYQHKGFIIDSEGNILEFNNPESWNFPDSTFTLSADKMVENIKLCKPSGNTISKDELQKYAGYIKNIASSKITAMKNTGDEEGYSEFVCYQFSENNLAYKGYLIKMEGDFTCENLNFYSKKVALWMKAINSSLPKD